MTIQAAAPHTPHQAPGPSTRWVIGGGAMALAAAALVTLWNPSDDGVVLCPFHAATGLDCPACGSLRAVAALGRGRPMDAADHNVLLIALPVLVVIGVLLRRAGVGARVLVIVSVVIVVAFWVVRNLPGVPFLGAGIG